MNILLYGPPGTGKTEFCKVLAERLGVTLYSVGEADDDGEEPSRRERLQELRLAQRLVSRDGRSLLLFDEMEDLLSDSTIGGLSLFGQSLFSGNRDAGSKVYMHRLLERAPAPTLWTMNDARSVSQTMLRRMMFALELRQPTRSCPEAWCRSSWSLVGCGYPARRSDRRGSGGGEPVIHSGGHRGSGLGLGLTSHRPDTEENHDDR